MLRAAILHECQNYLGDGGGLVGSEKNRGTVITSLQFAFRRRDRNFAPFTIHWPCFHERFFRSLSE